MENVIIKTDNLTKVYKRQKAVDNVNIHLKQGDIYGLIGENGSGKSTILKMIIGMVNPTSGGVEIFNSGDKKKLGDGRKRIGSVVETPSFFPYMSARENLDYYRIQKGIEDKKVVDEVLELIKLGELGKKKFKSFSLGMKQRLGIGLSLLSDPDILILDEPINGLDPEGIVDLRKLILRLNKEKGVTVLISSHILDELSQIATQYGFMKKGQLVREISKEELDRECRQMLKIKVNETELATTILERELKSLDYKVSNDGYIYLYDYINESETVVKILYENGIIIRSIVEEGMKLEDYYIDLVGGGKNA